jgi:hypothetical protein
VASIQNAEGQTPLSAKNVTKNATKADKNSPGTSSKALVQPIHQSECIRKPTEYMRRVLTEEGYWNYCELFEAGITPSLFGT